MTTTASPVTTPDRADASPRWSGSMKLAGGIALVAGVLCWSAGMVFSPDSESMKDADYIASMARDLTNTQISALFLHYANLLLGVGVLAAPSLVRGARGLGMVVVGALMTCLGCLNVSGMVLSDWWNAATGRLLSEEQAVAVFRHVQDASLLPIWKGTEIFAMLGIVVVLAGLARAGVLGWWTIGVYVLGFVGLMVWGATLPLAAAAGVLVAFSPLAVVGIRLVQRYRLETR
ncbi:hypothetical protein [Nocardioides caldifontis]|uniref:hypothetical protein n=1 Tax=Nocardioides caldifontis TaxID=2588938 RepID=UPI0011DF6881|nr:hypothetical protein [Nocardioides caldifontis]